MSAAARVAGLFGGGGDGNAAQDLSASRRDGPFHSSLEPGTTTVKFESLADVVRAQEALAEQALPAVESSPLERIRSRPPTWGELRSQGSGKATASTGAPSIPPFTAAKQLSDSETLQLAKLLAQVPPHLLKQEAVLELFSKATSNASGLAPLGAVSGRQHAVLDQGLLSGGLAPVPGHDSMAQGNGWPSWEVQALQQQVSSKLHAQKVAAALWQLESMAPGNVDLQGQGARVPDLSQAAHKARARGGPAPLPPLDPLSRHGSHGEDAHWGARHMAAAAAAEFKGSWRPVSALERGPSTEDFARAHFARVSSADMRGLPQHKGIMALHRGNAITQATGALLNNPSAGIPVFPQKPPVGRIGPMSAPPSVKSGTPPGGLMNTVAVQLALLADGDAPGKWCRAIQVANHVDRRALLRMAANLVAAGLRPPHLQLLLRLQSKVTQQRVNKAGAAGNATDRNGSQHAAALKAHSAQQALERQGSQQGATMQQARAAKQAAQQSAPSSRPAKAQKVVGGAAAGAPVPAAPAPRAQDIGAQLQERALMNALHNGVRGEGVPDREVWGKGSMPPLAGQEGRAAPLLSDLLKLLVTQRPR